MARAGYSPATADTSTEKVQMLARSAAKRVGKPRRTGEGKVTAPVGLVEVDQVAVRLLGAGAVPGDGKAVTATQRSRQMLSSCRPPAYAEYMAAADRIGAADDLDTSAYVRVSAPMPPFRSV